jgi:hypothetical protein
MNHETSDFLGAVGLGAVLAVIALMAVLTFVPGSIFQQAKEAKEACEATLPRDQHCKIIAVPEQDQEAA